MRIWAPRDISWVLLCAFIFTLNKAPFPEMGMFMFRVVGNGTTIYDAIEAEQTKRYSIELGDVAVFLAAFLDYARIASSVFMDE